MSGRITTNEIKNIANLLEQQRQKKYNETVTQLFKNMGILPINNNNQNTKNRNYRTQNNRNFMRYLGRLPKNHKNIVSMSGSRTNAIKTLRVLGYNLHRDPLNTLLNTNSLNVLMDGKRIGVIL